MSDALLSLTGLLALVAASRALAAPEDPEALIREGNELRRAGQDEKALPLFRRAYEVSATPRTAGQLGLAEFAVERFVEADSHLVEGLRARNDPWVTKHRATLEQALTTIRSRVAHVEVAGDPAGAEVLVNGRAVGRLPGTPTVAVNPGRVEIRVSLAEHEPLREVREVGPGAHEKVAVHLRRIAPVVVAARRGEPAPTPPHSHPWMRPTGLAVGIAGLAAVGTGVGLRLSADGKRDRIDQDARAGRPYDPGNGNWQSLQRTSTVCLIAGGAAAAGGLVLWFMGGERRNFRGGGADNGGDAPDTDGGFLMGPRFSRLILVALLQACSTDGPKANGFRCSTAGTCPPGYVCMEDRCWRGGLRPDGQAAQETVDATAPADTRDTAPAPGDSIGAAPFDAALMDGTAPAGDGPRLDGPASEVLVEARDQAPEVQLAPDAPTPSIDAPADGMPSPDLGPTGASNGSPCSRRQDCASSSCAPDGTCCDSDCTATCEACNVAGNLGRCTRVPSGQPHGKPACAGSGECAGSCNGTSPACVFPTSACGLASCSGNVLMKSGSCNGAGTCTPGGTQDCGAFRCISSACKTTCAGESDCASGNYCAGASGCLPTKANGQTCTSPAQCITGFCRDQVCCNESCTGPCRGSCSSGVCAVVKDGVDLDTCHTNDFCSTEGMCIPALVLNKSPTYDPVPLADHSFETCPNGAFPSVYLHRGKGTAMTGPGVISVRVVGAPVFTLEGTEGCDLPQVAGATCRIIVDFWPMGMTGVFQGQVVVDDVATGQSVTMRLHASAVTCP